MVEVLQRTSLEEWRVVENLYPELYRFAAVVAPWDLDADDLLHDALVAVLAKRTLSDLDHPGAYLRKVMVNIAAGHSRRMGSRRRALDRLRASSGSAAEPSHPWDMEELERIAPEARAVLYLAEVEGYHYDEIAQLLGITPAAARKRASRALQRLRTDLATEGPR